MINLLDETLDELERLGIKEEEVLYVAEINEDDSRQCKFMTWEMFKSKAYPKNYDEGLGIAEVNTEIYIYSVNYILYRHEYDGSEYWKEIPTVEYMHELLSGKKPEDFYI